jgi:hypothetical protein
MATTVDLRELDYYLPLDVATRKIYRQWVRQMIMSNTLLIVSDPFIQARTAALVSFNFFKIYPKSSVIIICGEKDRTPVSDQIQAIGIPSGYIHHVKNDKYFEKHPVDTFGVFYVSSKTMQNVLNKKQLGDCDFKLMIILNADKADSSSGPAKVVSCGITAGVSLFIKLIYFLPFNNFRSYSASWRLQPQSQKTCKNTINDF